MRTVFAIIPLSIFLLVSCGNDDYAPKPVGYFRIDLPEPTYVEKQPHCPFRFETSAQSRLEFFDTTITSGCWFDIHYPAFQAKMHLTYKPVSGNLREYLEESRSMTYEHQVKASRISSTIIRQDDKRLYGLVYDLGGNVASPVQFYITDSTDHFLRGSLYFEARPNPDSIAPVLNYIRKDIGHIIDTFSWE